MATRPASPTTRPQEGGTVLQLEGVDVPVRTRVLGRSERRITVEQALPFLRLDSQVTEGADRAARIRRVAVGFEEGVPRLIMELSYDESAPTRDGASKAPGERRDDATLPYGLDAHGPDDVETGAQAIEDAPRVHQRTLTFGLPEPGARADHDPRVASFIPGCDRPKYATLSFLPALRRGLGALTAWLPHVWWFLRRLKTRRV